MTHTRLPCQRLIDAATRHGGMKSTGGDRGNAVRVDALAEMCRAAVEQGETFLDITLDDFLLISPFYAVP